MATRRRTPFLLILTLLGWSLLYAFPAMAMPMPAAPAEHCATAMMAQHPGCDGHLHAGMHQEASCSCPHACQAGPALLAFVASPVPSARTSGFPVVIAHHVPGFTTPPYRPPSVF